MVSMASPLDHFNRFNQKQQHEASFSEDIRNVITGGYGMSRGDNVGVIRQRGVRARSPGLAAGAALTLGGGGGSTGQLPCAEANEVAKQNKERSRGNSCPFDDHSAFARREANAPPWAREEEPSRIMKPPSPKEGRQAYEASRNEGKRFRDSQQKVGSVAPWDAPETAVPVSSYAVASQGVASTSAPAASVEARREASTNRSRMKGADDLITGGYLLGESRVAAPVGRSGRPPAAPDRMLPQAMLKAQMDGLGPVSQDRAAYLNAKVMNEACRERNTNARLHLG
mmetsp:Transcript_47426/g.135985  ORF Transcript_47426/g.135985 Transcript_47426/m.135985 type:complete len:284 (+) Transcript_47426:97-948(+)